MPPEKLGKWDSTTVRALHYYLTYIFKYLQSWLSEHESTENASGLWYGETFDADAIDSEMIVIDSIGQRLRLHIDNVIGGGGQRFISIFCPYWVRLRLKGYISFVFLY